MEMIDKIIRNYNLNNCSFEKIKKGYATNKWHIITENNKSYLLKEINKQTKERIEFILLVQSKLKGLTPKIIKTKNNSLYCNVDTNFYYLSEFIKSNQIELEPKKIFNIGKILSNMHKKMAKITEIYSEFLEIKDNTEELVNYLDYHQKQKNKEYIDIIKYKLTILDKITTNNINFEKLDNQIIHGDFYIDNILFDGNTYKIIDFDQSCVFYKEYELLRGMFMISDIIKSEKQEILKKMSLFVKGYLTNNKISSPIDAYNLYLYVQANSLSSIKPDDYFKEEKRQFALKRFEILKFLNENKEDIIKILEGNYI